MDYQVTERRKLMEASDRYKRLLEGEFKEMTVKTNQLLTNALIIGGSLAFTYFVVSQLTNSSKKKKRTSTGQQEAAEEEIDNEPTLLKQLGSKFIDQVTLILLDIAKEKLSEYLQSKQRENS